MLLLFENDIVGAVVIAFVVDLTNVVRAAEVNHSVADVVDGHEFDIVVVSMYLI